METKFRPLPLSIIDFFGVVVPGFLWLVLIVTTAAMVRGVGTSITPAEGWQLVAHAVRTSGQWLGPLALIFMSFVIGYAAKPRAMAFATRLAAPLIRSADPRFKRRGVREVRFPFTALHEGCPYYDAVVKLVTDVVQCDLATLPGPQPFIAAKQLLRLAAPSLWEELEHREAEVRLLGVTFLAALYSVVLSVAEHVRQFLLYRGVSTETALWLVASLIIATVVGYGFGYLRLREVDYAYVHTLIAMNARRSLPPATNDQRPAADNP